MRNTNLLVEKVTEASSMMLPASSEKDTNGKNKQRKIPFLFYISKVLATKLEFISFYIMTYTKAILFYTDIIN